MIDFRDHREPVIRFLESGLITFRESHPSDRIGHVALYCCPWSGWVSLCIDPAAQDNQNCPDFKHVWVALYTATSWSEEYEQVPRPEITTLAGQSVVLDIEGEGDEAINREFFGFLRALLHSPEAEAAVRGAADGSVRIGVQLLDSSFSESWNRAA
jgi:hypothetical protein